MKKIPSVSIIVPARDEAGNIELLINTIPRLGSKTEVIFVEGFSHDGTWEKILSICKRKKRSNISLCAYKQEKRKGKEAATRLGFDKATGDILMILDADLSVDPKYLVKFYEAIANYPHRFVNGSRFIYPKEPFAMRYLNNIGNIVFARIFSVILGMKVTDTLCGTKVIWKKDWNRLKKSVLPFARHDPYGDFELFLGAHILNLEIVEIPVTYKARVYGKTKISRFRDGSRLVVVLGSFVWFLFVRRIHAFASKL